MCCRLDPGTLFLDLKLNPSKNIVWVARNELKKHFPMQCLSKRAKNWGQKNKLQQASLNVLIGSWKKNWKSAQQCNLQRAKTMQQVRAKFLFDRRRALASDGAWAWTAWPMPAEMLRCARASMRTRTSRVMSVARWGTFAATKQN